MRTFEPELAAAGDEREELLDCLDAAMSWGTWEVLRASLGRSQAAAEQVMRRLAAAALS